MAKLTRQTVPEASLVPVFSAADATGDTFPNDDRTWVHLKNTHATLTRTATFVAQKASVKPPGHGDLPLANVVVVLPALTGEAVVALPPAIFNANGNVSVTYDAVTNLTIAVMRREID